MKSSFRTFLLLMTIVLASMVSCVNGEVSEPLTNTQADPNMPALSEQVAYMEASVSDLNALIDALDSECASLLEAKNQLQKHIDHLKDGSSMKEAAMAAMRLQASIAEAVASVDTEGCQDLMDRLETGVMLWLGEDLSYVYPLTYASSKAAGLVSDMENSKLYVDGIASDIEAGLRKEIGAEEINSLDKALTSEMESASEMNVELSGLLADVEQEYEQFIALSCSSENDYDMERLKSLNKSVEQTLKSVDDSFAGLVARVAECEAQLAEILDRIAELEDKVEDLNELLGMIQSVAFISETSDDGAVAYYNLDSQLTADGMMSRKPADQIELCYLIRPASASMALAGSSLWNNELKVLGYYADIIQTKSVDPNDIEEFTIQDVVVNSQSGLVKVKIANTLSEDFYFKRIGMKMALSIADGKTDMTSRFVDVTPVDQSGDVYVETLTLSSGSIEVENGQTARLQAVLTPENPTVPGVVWTSSDNNVASVDADGLVTGNGVGTVVVTATSKGIDEWGKKLTASCTVKVIPSVKILGPDSVEEGGQTTLSLQSPNYISSDFVTWEVGVATRNVNGEVTAFNMTQAFASIDDDGVLKGLKMYYNTNDAVKDYVPVTVRCTVDGAVPIVLYHDVRVVAVQPQGISINGMSDTDTQIKTKHGVALGLYGTIKPENVNADYFKLAYLGNTPGFDGYFSASNVGTFDVTVSVQPGGTGQYNYMYPKGRNLARNITVVVEPYYVSTVELPETFTMNPNQTATLSATFTSDVAGKDPTYKDLKWTSSDPSVVSVNETTGEMTSYKEGTVTITATTAHQYAVPEGQSQKSAKCMVTVKTPVAPIAVGDYYYSDGTWSTDRDAGKTVIGVVFATANAVASDPALRSDYPNCTNGLVVSTKEYTSACASGRGWSYADLGNWCSGSGYTYYNDTSNPCGYSNTKGYMAANAASIQSYGYTINFTLFNSSSPVAQHRASVSAPSSASAWYVPSYKEMQLLYENRETVNSAINGVSGDPLHVARADYDDYYYQYWCSTFDLDNNIVKAFNMKNGDWFGSKTETTVLPVRVILAF